MIGINFVQVAGFATIYYILLTSKIRSFSKKLQNNNKKYRSLLKKINWQQSTKNTKREVKCAYLKY